MTVQDLIEELLEIVEAKPELTGAQVIDREGSVIDFVYHDGSGLHIEPNPGDDERRADDEYFRTGTRYPGQ
jgi:hypothetical protein